MKNVGFVDLSKPKVLDFQRNPTEKLELCPWICPPFFVADLERQLLEETVSGIWNIPDIDGD